jgi:choline dehydrogenase-like flavoprotein
MQQFAPGDSHHEAGGLMMGSDPTSSVTDPFGRFHSIPNVVVADAATWPTTSAANPCLTISALARRQAQQLHDDLT